MGSGSNTVTTNQSQQYTPNPAVGGAGSQAISAAQTAAQAPFSQPVAPIAPFTPFQSIGFGETLGLQGMAQPYFNTGANYLQQSAAPVTGTDVANYYNPMAANVTAQMQNIFGQQMREATGRDTQLAGGVGADRIAVAQANLANQQGLAAGQTYSQLYQQALQAAEQQKQMAAGAGYGLGQMGPAAQAAQQNAINQLLGVGAQQQGLNQAQLNAIYQNQLAQIAYPFQTAQYLAGITGALAPAMGGTTTGQATTTYPQPSMLSQLMGGGMFGLGALGQMGGGGYNPFATGSNFAGASAVGQGAPMNFMQSYGSGSPFGYYPMPGGGSAPGYFQAGGTVDDYGDLAKRQLMGEFGKTFSAAAQGNPLAEEVKRSLGYQHGGKIIDIRPQLEPDDLATALQRSANLTRGAGASGYQEADPDAIVRARRQGVLKIFPSGEQDGGAIQPTLVGDVVRLDPFAGSNESIQDAFNRLENRKTLAASGLRAANPLAVDRAKEAGVLKIFPSPKGLQEGGPAQQQKRDALAHELFRQQWLRQHLDPTGGVFDDTPTAGAHMRNTLSARPNVPWLKRDLESAPEADQDRYSFPGDYSHIQSGGVVDDISQQQFPTGSPMVATGDLPFPGASRPKIGGTPIPQVQLQPGAGRSGMYGQFLNPFAQHQPMQNPQAQQGGAGGMGGLGGSLGQGMQLVKGLGNLGSLFGGGAGAAGAGAAGAGVDFAAGTADLGASIDEIGAMLPLALAANRGGPVGYQEGGYAPEEVGWGPLGSAASDVGSYVGQSLEHLTAPPGGPPSGTMDPGQLMREKSPSTLPPTAFERPDPGRTDMGTMPAQASIPYPPPGSALRTDFVPAQPLPPKPTPTPFSGLATIDQAAARAQAEGQYPPADVPLPRPRPDMSAIPPTAQPTMLRPAAPRATLPPINVRPGYGGQGAGGGYGEGFGGGYGQPSRGFMSPQMSNFLMRAGATMMATPGNIGTAIGRGLGAGITELDNDEKIAQKSRQLEEQAAMHLARYQLSAEKTKGSLENAAERLKLQREALADREARAGEGRPTSLQDIRKEVYADPVWGPRAQSDPAALRAEIQRRYTEAKEIESGRGAGARPTPTQQDLDWVKAHPEDRAKFVQRFGIEP